MPQRRTFAPNPMQPATTVHGGSGRPPMPMQPQAQPLPPAGGGQGGTPLSPMQQGMQPSPRVNIPSSIPLTAAPMTGPTPQGMGGMGGGPAPAPPTPGQGQGTVDPLNVSQFLSPMQPQQGPAADAMFDDSPGSSRDRERGSHESTTTSASLHGGQGGNDDDDYSDNYSSGGGGDTGQLPMALLKMLGTLGKGRG